MGASAVRLVAFTYTQHAMSGMTCPEERLKKEAKRSLNSCWRIKRGATLIEAGTDDDNFNISKNGLLMTVLSKGETGENKIS